MRNEEKMKQEEKLKQYMLITMGMLARTMIVAKNAAYEYSNYYAVNNGDNIVAVRRVENLSKEALRRCNRALEEMENIEWICNDDDNSDDDNSDDN